MYSFDEYVLWSESRPHTRTCFNIIFDKPLDSPVRKADEEIELWN